MTRAKAVRAALSMGATRPWRRPQAFPPPGSLLCEDIPGGRPREIARRGGDPHDLSRPSSRQRAALSFPAPRSRRNPPQPGDGPISSSPPWRQRRQHSQKTPARPCPLRRRQYPTAVPRPRPRQCSPLLLPHRLAASYVVTSPTSVRAALSREAMAPLPLPIVASSATMHPCGRPRGLVPWPRPRQRPPLPHPHGPAASCAATPPAAIRAAQRKRPRSRRRPTVAGRPTVIHGSDGSKPPTPPPEKVTSTNKTQLHLKGQRRCRRTLTDSPQVRGAGRGGRKTEGGGRGKGRRAVHFPEACFPPKGN